MQLGSTFSRYGRTCWFVLAFVFFATASLSPPGLQAQSDSPFRNAAEHEPEFLQQSGEAPQPGEVYTMENIDELYPWMPKFTEHLITTWKQENQDLRIEIGKTEHVEFPESYIQATKDLSGNVTMNPDGTVEGYKAGMPFPTERTIGEGYNALDKAIENGEYKKAGWMILWNFLYHPRANARKGAFATRLVDRNGFHKVQVSAPHQVQHNHRTANYPNGTINLGEKPLEVNYKYMPVVESPASAKDISQLILLPDAISDFNAEMSVYAYLPSLRRVVPLSGAGSAHCAPTVGTDYYVDDLFGFAGVPSWFNVKYLGRAQMLYPFDPDLSNVALETRKQFNRNFTNGGIPKNAIWQLRPMYVIELTPKSGHEQYCYPKRRLYVDAETSWGSTFEVIDKKKVPWKMTIFPPGKTTWTPEGNEYYYDTNGVQLIWDFQAKHGSWSTSVPGRPNHATNAFSSSDLTPTGLLKVIK